MTSSTEQQQMLERAIRAHTSGNLGAAEKLYRGVLGADANQPDALHYLGVIGLQVGRLAEAVELIQRAVAARPDYVDAIVNLGNGLNSLGRYDAAVEQFERALALTPATAPLLANLGGALQQLGLHAEAVERFRAALELQPELAETRRSLADSLLEMGRMHEALREITLAVSTGPRSIAMQVSMGNILQATGRTDDAIRCFEELLAAEPELLPVRCSLANIMQQTGNYSAAIELYENVLKQDPKHVESLENLGLAYRDLGDKDKALVALRRAVELDPSRARAWQGISSLSENAFNEAEVQLLLSMERSDQTVLKQRMFLGFALGKHFEDAGRHAEAAEQYLLANPIRRSAFDYNIDDDLRVIDKLRERVDADFLATWANSGIDDERPIFIIGMPRSGTTLVEQILASHPRVFGAGELTLLARSIIETFHMPDGFDYTNALEDASIKKFKTVAGRYLDGLPDVDADRITDKLPHNFLNVGMIRILFPKARIVHCRRDPRDTCFSIYKSLFSAHGHFYAYDLEELANYYKGYVSLMQHWDDVMPGIIHTIDYEMMIDDQETTTRALLDACGLDWDPACLEFYRLERPVATISASQVRQPLYRNSIGAWRNYEKLLAPLIDILERD